VGAEDDDSPAWHVGKIVDEDRALVSQLRNDVAVVNNFLPNVNRRAKGLQRNSDHVNRADNAGTEAPRLRHEERT
jgi:hypothetical protein